MFVLGLALGAVALIALLAVVLKWAPQWLAVKGLSPKDEAEELGRVRAALLACLAGLIAVVGAVFAGLTFRLNQQGQITERFTRAVDQLGSKDIDVRLGGIYALERLARDSLNDHPQIMEVLTAYVREHAPRCAATSSSPAPTSDVEPAVGELNESRAPTDVQAVMTVLARRNVAHDRPKTQLDLRRTQLEGLHVWSAAFASARFEGVNGNSATFGECDLARANFLEALLSDAYFWNSNLENASFFEAKLIHAHMARANLTHANCFGADMQRVILLSADLRGADLRDADLRWGELDEADLREAVLCDADLREAELAKADLRNANLTGADLRQTYLGGTRFEGAILDGVNLEGARYESTTTWPDRFVPEDHGARWIREHDRD